MSENLLTIHEAADYLKVHWQTIRNYIKEDKLPSTKIGRTVRIKESDIQALLNEEQQEKEPEVTISNSYLVMDRKRIESIVIDAGAELQKHEQYQEHWFVPESIGDIRTLEEWREEDNGSILVSKHVPSSPFLELSQPNHANLPNLTLLTDEKQVQSFIESLRYKKIVEVTLTKTIYEFRGKTVEIIEIEDVGTGITISSTDKSQAMLDDIAEELQLSHAPKLESGFEYLILEKLWY